MKVATAALAALAVAGAVGPRPQPLNWTESRDTLVYRRPSDYRRLRRRAPEDVPRALRSTDSAAGTCIFIRDNAKCLLAGESCCADTLKSECHTPGGTFVPTFCRATSLQGTEGRRALATSAAEDSYYSDAVAVVDDSRALQTTGVGCGVCDTSPRMFQEYQKSCLLLDVFDCQFADVTHAGENNFPSVMKCDVAVGSLPGHGKCLFGPGEQETGDPCSTSGECVSGICMRGVCQGIKLNGACVSGGCADGLYCDVVAGACLARKKVGSRCDTATGCVRGSKCNFAGISQTCTGLYSLSTGQLASDPDLCASGYLSKDGTCGNPNMGLTGASCDCTENNLPSGMMCGCAFGGQCKYEPVTRLSPDMNNARQALWQCLTSAIAADGTPCTVWWDDLHYRATDVGTCAWYYCYPQFMSYYAVQQQYQRAPFVQFSVESVCEQNIDQQFSSAAAGGLIPCDVPPAWAANGWSCRAMNLMTPGLSAGAVAGVTMVSFALVGAAFYALYGGSPAFRLYVHNKADDVTTVLRRYLPSALFSKQAGIPLTSNSVAASPAKSAGLASPGTPLSPGAGGGGSLSATVSPATGVSERTGLLKMSP